MAPRPNRRTPSRPRQRRLTAPLARVARQPSIFAGGRRPCRGIRALGGRLVRGSLWAEGGVVGPTWPVKAWARLDDGADVSPSERAFLTAVLRYQTILADRDADPGEKQRLERFLGSAEDGDERRRHRRLPTRVRATLRTHDVAGPCTVTNVGGGGLRIHNDRGLRVRPGDRAMISLEHGPETVRVDVPIEIRHLDADADGIGARFLGPPLMLRQRKGVQGRSAVRRGRRRRTGTVEVPVAA